MLSKLALIFVFSFVSINNISFNKVNKQFDNEKICPNNLMTEGIFNSDFSSYITMPDIDLLRNDRVTYFYNLCTYSPKNSHGSCGYVSLIQYLSYYDCFYNDSIISVL